MTWLRKILSPFRKIKRPKIIVSNDGDRVGRPSPSVQSNSLNLHPGQRIEIFRIDQVPVFHEDTIISVFQHYSVKEKVVGSVVQVVSNGPKVTVRFQNPVQGAMVATFTQGQKVRILS